MGMDITITREQILSRDFEKGETIIKRKKLVKKFWGWNLSLIHI